MTTEEYCVDKIVHSLMRAYLDVTFPDCSMMTQHLDKNIFNEQQLWREMPKDSEINIGKSIVAINHKINDKIRQRMVRESQKFHDNIEQQIINLARQSNYYDIVLKSLTDFAYSSAIRELRNKITQI